MTLPIRKGIGGGLLEPAPRRKHTERQPGESYPDALSRVAGERDAALHDVAKLRDQVANLTRLADDLDNEGYELEDNGIAGNGAGPLWATAARIRHALGASVKDES